MIRFDLPDNATDEEIEKFLATLDERAREGARAMLLEGAGEAEIAEYIEGVDRLVAAEEESGFEEEEAAAAPPAD